MTGEAFAIAAMLAAVGALIALFAWHLRRIGASIDLDLSDACAWGEVIEPPVVDCPADHAGGSTL